MNFVKPFFLCLLLLLGGCGRRHLQYYEEPPIIHAKKSFEEPFIETPVKAGGPLVIVDPGHGGKDMGTQSIKGPKYYEKNLTLSTSRYVCQYLQMLGFKTMMTRDRDEFIELKDRADFANKKKPVAFVSVHFNSAPSKEASGIEVYYYKSDTDKSRTNKSKLLASKILDGTLSYTKAKSRGVKHGNFLVIRETDVPSVIVEGGFMTHDEEMQNIRDSAYLKKLAMGIAQGVKKFMN